MARRTAMALGAAMLVLSLLPVACSDPEARRGRPEYFERVTGQPMLMGEPRLECERGTFHQAAAAISYTLTPEQMEWFLDPPDVFRERPVIYGDTDGRALQTWREGIPNEVEMEMWGVALGAVYYALEGEQCTGRYDVKGVAEELRRLVRRPTTLHAFTYIPQPPDALLLSWYMIDPEDNLFWIIDSSP